MASLAASVARLTHPRSQTGRGRGAELSAAVLGDRSVGDGRDEAGVGTPHSVAGSPGSQGFGTS